jgi:hypothetical protein
MANHLTFEDRMLGIAGPLTAEQEADLRTYFDYFDREFVKRAGDELAKRLDFLEQRLLPVVGTATTNYWLDL